MWTFWRNVTEEIECYIREMFRVCDNFECDCTDISWYDSVGLIRVPTRSEWITHNLINGDGQNVCTADNAQTRLVYVIYRIQFLLAFNILYFSSNYSRYNYRSMSSFSV